MTTSNETVFECSFCGKTQREVFCLIAGPRVYICDECVGHCHKIVEERRREAVGITEHVNKEALLTPDNPGHPAHPVTCQHRCCRPDIDGNMPSTAPSPSSATELAAAIATSLQAAVREAERNLSAAFEAFANLIRREVFGITSAPRQQVEGIISIDVTAPAHSSSEK